MKISDTKKSVGSGAMFLTIGAAGLILAQRFDFGSAAQPGPGFFPTVLAVLLLAVGLLVTAKGLRESGETIPAFALRPLALITLSVLFFAVTIEEIGLMPAVLVTTIIATFALGDFGWLSRLLLAVGLSIFSAVIFYGLLRIPFELWTF